MELSDVTKVVDALGSNLVTLVEYYMGDKTYDLIICNELDFDTLTKLKDISSVPTVFTLDEIVNARDVFPIEFLNISRHHLLFYGEDILKDVVIKKGDLRRQLEFEFRSKLVHLRRAYLRAKDNADIDEIILDAVPTMAPIIGGLMHMKNLEGKFDIKTFRDAYGIDAQVLLDIYHVRHGKGTLSENKGEYIEKLISLLTEIGQAVDKIEVAPHELAT